jgi:hypothetical protein
MVTLVVVPSPLPSLGGVMLNQVGAGFRGLIAEVVQCVLDQILVGYEPAAKRTAALPGPP